MVIAILIFKFLDSKLENKHFAPNDDKHVLTSIILVYCYEKPVQIPYHACIFTRDISKTQFLSQVG
jgi:hypothetical protein